MQWIESELQINGLGGCEPSIERVRVFSTAFGEVIDMLPSYRPFLLALQKEYEGLVQKLQTEYNTVAPLEGRLKTQKAESFAFVGETMCFFQTEIGSLRRRYEEAEAERSSLREERERLVQENAALREASEKDQYIASESHQQNVDITKHLDRCEKQIEQLRKSEKDLHSQIKELELKVSKKEFRIVTVEGQLDEERQRLANMVPKEEHETLREELKHSEARYKQLEEQYAAKQKDYLNIVETYSKRVGQVLNAKEEMRPLTPRPTWRSCHGVMDPDMPHSVDKAEIVQELLQTALTRARSIISVFGLSVGSQKSKLVQAHTKHPLALALTGTEDPKKRRKYKSEHEMDEEELQALRQPGAEEGGFFLPDVDGETPLALRHTERIKNLNFSRKKVADFIDSLMKERGRHAPGAYSTSFLQHMIQHVTAEIGEGERTEQVDEFVINIFSSVRRYAVEPDFLAYLLLLLGKLPETMVRDNKLLCIELLRLFMNNFELDEAAHSANIMTKSKFCYALRDVLQNKSAKMWQEVYNNCFPHGPGDLLIDFDAMLSDDFYVFSPLVYWLRLQHMEEVISLMDRLSEAVREAAGLVSVVTYGQVQQAVKDDPELSMILPEEYAKAFGVPLDELKPETERDTNELLNMMYHGDLFHLLYFPCLSPDDAEHHHPPHEHDGPA